MPSRSSPLNNMNGWDTNLAKSYTPKNHYPAIWWQNITFKPNNELTEGEEAFLMEKIMSDFQTLTQEKYAKLLEAKRLADETYRIIMDDSGTSDAESMDDLINTYMGYKP